MNLVKNLNRITSIIITVINLIWTEHWISLFHDYYFTKILWLYMYPNWVLILNISIGLIGIYIGFRLIKNNIHIFKALSIVITLLILGLLVSYYVPS